MHDDDDDDEMNDDHGDGNVESLVSSGSSNSQLIKLNWKSGATWDFHTKEGI
jgi:hypothetical protein